MIDPVNMALLEEVTDVLGNTTGYEYNQANQIIKSTDAAGRQTTISYDQYGNVSSVTDSQGKGKFFEYHNNEAAKEQYSAITTSSETT